MVITRSLNERLSARFTANRVTQTGLFAVPPFFSDIAEGSDSAWIADASLSYRLPILLGLLSMEIRNLFDERFPSQETDVAYPRFSRERLFLLRGVPSFDDRRIVRAPTVVPN